MSAVSALDNGTFAIRNVNVVPVAVPGVLVDCTVHVSAGRISRISASVAADVPPDATVVDGGGRWLVPGLADMHVHITDAEQLVVMIAHGVTHVRNMWGSPEIRALRDEVHRGARLGPVIHTAGPLVDGSPPVWPGSTEVNSAADADPVVRAQQAAGYDFVKVYSNLEPPVFEALATACREHGFPFAGHVPYRVPLEDAVDSGAASFEHLLGFKRAVARPRYPLGMLMRAPENVAVARRVASGELALDDVFDPERLESLATRIAAKGLWTCPTLVVIRNLLYTQEQSRTALARSASRYVPSALLDFWNPEKDFRRAGAGDDDLSAMQAFFPQDLECVAALHRAGAPLLVGTDTPNPYVVPGDALHEEMELFVQAGLTAEQTLHAATAAAADFRGERGRSGAIVEGASADLVLVESNPLEDIRALRQIAGVMLRGRWLPREHLDAELERCATHYATTPTTFVTPGGYGGMLPLCSCCS